MVRLRCVVGPLLATVCDCCGRAIVWTLTVVSVALVGASFFFPSFCFFFLKSPPALVLALGILAGART